MSGSAGGAVVADDVKKSLADAGLDVRGVRVSGRTCRFPRPVAVDIVTPVTQSLRVTEPASDLDPDTKHPDLGPGFVAYSASADVTAPIVYVNYGLPADYAQLSAQGVDVRGKLVIARYGRSHRAVKLHSAEQAGAVGLVLTATPQTMASRAARRGRAAIGGPRSCSSEAMPNTAGSGTATR